MPVNSFDSYPLTWKPDKAKLTQPYYKALAEDLEETIKSRRLAPGAKLPPQREIADYLDLNYTTITRAYSLCEKKGLIYGVVGRGTFVAPHWTEEAPASGTDSAAPFIEMGTINGFSEYSRLVEQATEAVVKKGYLRSLYEYSYPAGHPHQLAAAVRWMEQLGVHTDARHTAIFAGAQNALLAALIAVFPPGAKIAVDPYTYSSLIELSKLLGVTLVPAAGDGEGMLPQALDRLCEKGRVSGVYLMPMCANPTAITMPLARREALAQVIRRRGLILLEDDISAWMDAARGETLPSLFDLLEGQSLYICGMSKSLCPGLRIAYMAFGESFRQAVLHGLYNINIKTSSLDAEIITELILNGGAYEIAAHKRLLAERTCAAFAEFFPEIQTPANAGYFKWVPLPVRISAAQAEGELLRRGVRVCHSSRFAAGGRQDRDFLRVALCSTGSPRKLAKGLSILREYLEELSCPPL